MKARYFLSLAVLLPALFGCGGNNETTSAVKLRYGTLIGNLDDDRITATSQLTFIKKSFLARLAKDKENFVLLLHGSEDTCSCYTTWHNEILAPYIKRNRMLVYAITLEEFETDTDYYGLKRVSGYDTLAIFKDGEVAYQKSTDDQADPFVTNAASFNDWMAKRVQKPKIFYVNEDLLDGFYAGNDPFTVYFARGTCGDCGYMDVTGLRNYLDAHDTLEKNFFVIDFDVYRPSKTDPDYDAKMEIYAEKKAKYGLDLAEDNPAGFSTGAFPTVYYVTPDGESKRGDVIEAAGVFYNDFIKDGSVVSTYFTKERYESAKDTYLSYLSSVSVKWLDELSLTGEGDRHELLAPYEEPMLNALLDYSVGN